MKHIIDQPLYDHNVLVQHSSLQHSNCTEWILYEQHIATERLLEKGLDVMIF